MRQYKLGTNVNGTDYSLKVSAKESLLDLLRGQLNLTGAKRGCDSGVCGACTVLIDGIAVKSCLVLALQAEGRRIVTIEGLAGDGELHPLQRAFIDKWAIQCGYCSPGMILASKALLEENPSPSDDDIRMYLAGNLCRCTGYQKIIEAVASVRGPKGE